VSKNSPNKKITIGGGVKDLADVQMGQENNFDHMVIGKAIYENKFSLDDLIKFNA
jgi:phosphoribosylformimino-5-aminoimidazole carboxamide ribonucleotide (ProFAR) isomerase